MDNNALTNETAIEFIQENLTKFDMFTVTDKLQSEAITEGNVNLLFRIFAENEPEKRSVLIKQALPFAWRYPDFKMPLDRQRIEYEILSVESQYCPTMTPKIYFYDKENHILAIEYLGEHLVMREGLMKQIEYPLVGKQMGVFLARTLFHTSDLFLSSSEKKAMVPKFINPVLCKVQEDLVFSEPYMEHSNNKWSELLESQVRKVYENDELRNEVFKLKYAYMNHAQALLHNDLHTGSIMVNQEETKVIDPEFGFYGPMGHDIGSYLGNLALSYASQEFHALKLIDRINYRKWIAETMRETWNVFESEFMYLWETSGNGQWSSTKFKQDFMHQLLRDSAGFGATEMMRRLIGMAHVQDFWTIEDEKQRAIAESIALNIAQTWLMNRYEVTSIDDLVNIMFETQATI